MGVIDAPQWLLSAWVRSCAGAGATAPVDQIRAVGSRLIDNWSGPGRHFHNLKHLADVLARVDELAEEAHEPEVVRLAAWYHGAVFSAANDDVYANRGGEDEFASAEMARTELTALGITAVKAQRIHDLVIALRRHSPTPGDFDCAVLCDADLAMLASEPQKYKAYLLAVRAEYSHLPVEDYVRARIRILTKLQQRRNLFVSPLGSAWEAAARQNVTAELHRLEKELTKIEAGATPTEEAATPNTAAFRAVPPVNGAPAAGPPADGAPAAGAPAAGAPADGRTQSSRPR